MCLLLPLPKEERVEVVSAPSAEEQQEEDEEEAPEELHSYQAEVTFEQPGDMLLEQAGFVTEPQALACQQAQTTEVLNGGSHQAEQDSPLQEEGQHHLSLACWLVVIAPSRYLQHVQHCPLLFTVNIGL